MIIETTEATAPDETPTDLPPEDALAGQGSGAGEGGEGPPEPKKDPDEAALEAFSKGVAEASGEPKTAADVVAEAGATVPAKEPAKGAKGATAAAAPAPAAAPAAPEPDPETDKEVQDLRLKGRAEARFRELTGQVKELTPLRETLAKHQITDPAKIETVIQDAARAQEWEDTVIASTATPEQFSSALNVIKAMNADDPKLQNIAFDVLIEQISALGRRLGRDVPGLVDPLADHTDLQTEVANGDISRERALEIARQRAVLAATEAREGARSTQQESQTAIQQAIGEVATLSDTLKASDPDFERKLALLQPTLDIIRETVPPAQWRAKIERAYQSLPKLPPLAAATAAATKPRVPVSHMPVRPTGTSAGMQPKPRSDLEAFQMGMRSVMPD